MQTEIMKAVVIVLYSSFFPLFGIQHFKDSDRIYNRSNLPKQQLCKIHFILQP